MSDVFGEIYSGAYDLIYGEKDYEAECDLIESICARYSTTRVMRILDLCCGTGNHATVLAKRGYLVTGVDRSEFMIRRASEKSKEQPQVEYLVGDVRDFRLPEKFDCVLMMFAALGYQTSDADLQAALHTVRSHLATGGVFVFDVWYAPAVRALKPAEKRKTFQTADSEIIRISSGTLLTDAPVCVVHIDLQEVKNNRTVRHTREDHPMRYFDAEDLGRFLENANLKLMHFSAFPSLDLPPDENSWNVIGVASAR